MPRGGARPGAGRPRKNPDAPAKKRSTAKKQDLGRGMTLPNGLKSPDAPQNWPFGTKPPEAEMPAVDPESDDGLTDEERAGLTPLEYLLAIMRSPKASKSARMTAAIQAAPYVHPKLAPAGKKEAKKDAAKGAAGGRFAAAAPPRLAASGGKRI